MVELSNERIKQMLEEETKKTEDLTTILRAIYTRYMNLYERYFAELDALNDDKIAEYKKYHEETKSLIKYYYMDIPQDVCAGINEFEEKAGDKLLGREWKKTLYDAYTEFREKYKVRDRSEEYYKEAFKKEALKAFYDAMDSVFRSGFGTGSETVQEVIGGITGLLFGKKDK